MRKKEAGPGKYNGKPLPAVSPDAPQQCDYHLALHPDNMGQDVRLWGTEVTLPPGAKLIVGYAGATDTPEEGKAMVVAGTRGQVIRVLKNAGYQIGEEGDAEDESEQTLEVKEPEATTGPSEAARAASRDAAREAVRRIETLVHQLGIEIRKLQVATEEDGGSAADRAWRTVFLLTPMKVVILASSTMIHKMPTRRYESDTDRTQRETLQEELQVVMSRCLAELERLNAEDTGEDALQDLPIR